MMWLAQSKPLWQLQALRRCSKPHYFLQSLFHSDTPRRNTKVAPLQEARMRDRFNLYAKGGDGSNGSTTIRRSRHERHGKPDDKGRHGISKNKIGTHGGDKVVSVPVGTVIHLLQVEIPSVVETQTQTDLDPWELPELTDRGQRLVIACGGEGGLGNVCYPNLMIKRKLLKQGNSRDDGFDVEEPTDDPSSLRIGSPGSEVSPVLVLKSIADVGLVGMPNAGKSRSYI